MKIILRFVKIGVLFCVLILSALLSASADERVDLDYVEDYIVESLHLRLDVIDVYSFSLNEEQIFSALDKVVKGNPELYFVGDSFYYIADKSGIVKEITPVYIYSKKEAKNIKIYCDRELEKILFSVDSNMSDFTKALVLHEYMCESFRYDNSLKNYTMYDLLRDGRGTCQAFMLTYMELLSRVGIESSYAYSNEIMHIWNVIKLDGEWYHVDITWDNMDFGVSHKNFLLTDMEIERNGHTGFIIANGVECNNEKYSNLSLRDAPYKYECFRGGFLYIDNASRCVYYDKLDGGEKILVYRIDELWAKGEGRYYANSFSLPVNAGNKLYFNTKNKIMSIDESFNVCEVAELGLDIFGIKANARGLICYSDREKKAWEELEIKKSMDADGDGAVTVLDIAALNLHINNEAFIYKYNVDSNGDRLLDGEDVKALEKYILNSHGD